MSITYIVAHSECPAEYDAKLTNLICPHMIHTHAPTKRHYPTCLHHRQWQCIPCTHHAVFRKMPHTSHFIFFPLQYVCSFIFWITICTSMMLKVK